MSNKFKFTHIAKAYVIKRKNKVNHNTFNIQGQFQISCYSPDGTLKWEKTAKNGVTNGGLDSILDVYFNVTNTVGGTAAGGAPAWGFALGLIDNSGYTGIAAGDTHDSHTGWTEFTNYAISADTDIRPEWNPDAAASQSLTNSTLIDFDINGAGGTVVGLFLVGGSIAGAAPGANDADNKGGSSATPDLWSTALFDGGSETVSNGDTLRVGYTISASAA